MEIKVAIFEDNKLMRAGFEAICNGIPGLTCCGVFPDANDLIHKISKNIPDVVLMDIEMQGLNGINATQRIVAQWPEAVQPLPSNVRLTSVPVIPRSSNFGY